MHCNNKIVHVIKQGNNNEQVIANPLRVFASNIWLPIRVIIALFECVMTIKAFHQEQN